MAEQISNGESALSVRNKLNDIILNGVKKDEVVFLPNIQVVYNGGGN